MTCIYNDVDHSYSYSISGGDLRTQGEENTTLYYMEVSSKIFQLGLLILVAVLEKRASATTTHVVGDGEGWDTSTDLSSWASKQTFKVGDELEFKYTMGLHSVVELADEKAYKGCDISTPLSTSTAGDDRIKLTKSGTRFFTCGTSSHCVNGMKVKITTVAAEGGSTGPSTVTQPSSSEATSSIVASSNKVQILSFFALVASLMVPLI
ncbi:hypothetical protein OROGR_022487 [Orobanche gracilis]